MQVNWPRQPSGKPILVATAAYFSPARCRCRDVSGSARANQRSCSKMRCRLHRSEADEYDAVKHEAVGFGGTPGEPTAFARLLHLFQFEPTGLPDLHEHEYKR
jgi:hypothetical protein